MGQQPRPQGMVTPEALERAHRPEGRMAGPGGASRDPPATLPSAHHQQGRVPVPLLPEGFWGLSVPGETLL